jgi:small subunit ribosomal protein S20
MANTKSAIKRIRRISKQTAVNKARKSRYKIALKKMNVLIENKKKSEALKFLPKLNSELMKIAKTGIIKKQNASRNVSRITKKMQVAASKFIMPDWREELNQTSYNS